MLTIHLSLSQILLSLFLETASRRSLSIKAFPHTKHHNFHRSLLMKVISCLTLTRMRLNSCLPNKQQNVQKTINHSNKRRMIMIIFQSKLSQNTKARMKNQGNFNPLRVKNIRDRFTTLIKTKTITLDLMMNSSKIKEKYSTKKRYVKK